MTIKRLLIVTVTLAVVVAAAGFHWLFGYSQHKQLGDKVTVLHRKNLIHQIGANVTVYADSGVLLVVDTQLKPVSSATRSKVEATFAGSIAKVVVTHWHPDHSGGISAYSGDTDIYAHENVVHRLSQAQEGFGLTKPGSHHQFKARNSDGLPNQVIGSGEPIPVGAATVAVIHYPRAHTDGDLVVFFHDAKSVAIGDLVWAQSFPYIDVHNGGTARGLEAALQEIIDQSQPGYQFIPGHGHVMTFKAVVDHLKAINGSRLWVESHIQQGRSLAEIIDIGLPERWSRWSSELVPPSEWITMIYQSYPNVRSLPNTRLP
ncbi:MAG: MBL fold metallo-hydrolase [Pseudomonadales bacterium]